METAMHSYTSGRLRIPSVLWACLLSYCAGNNTGAFGETGSGKYEMYANDEGTSVVEITFLKGRCCGRLTLDAKSPEARDEVIRVAEQLAGTIPIDGSVPTTDEELVGLLPRPGSGWMSEWEADPDTDPDQGPEVISTNAFDWANGSAGPFEDNGFEAVAMEVYTRESEGWTLALDLLYMSSPEGADAAFHYRSPGYPDEPYWDLGTRIH